MRDALGNLNEHTFLTFFVEAKTGFMLAMSYAYFYDSDAGHVCGSAARQIRGEHII